MDDETDEKRLITELIATWSKEDLARRLVSRYTVEEIAEGIAYLNGIERRS